MLAQGLCRARGASPRGFRSPFVGRMAELPFCRFTLVPYQEPHLWDSGGKMLSRVLRRFGDFRAIFLVVDRDERDARRMRQDDVTLVVIVAGAIDERG